MIPLRRLRVSLPKRTNRRPLLMMAVIPIVLLAAPSLAAQASPGQGTPPAGSTAKQNASQNVLFISSDPIGAVVIFDGKTILSRTPIMLRDVSPGKHNVEIARNGYVPFTGTIDVAKGKPASFNTTLKQQFFEPIFGSSSTVLIKGKPADYTSERYQLPSGEYEVAGGEGVVSITPVYPADQILGVVDVATAALVLASAVLVGETLVYWGNIGGTTSSGSSNPGNPSSYSPVWVATGITALSDLFLHIQKAHFLDTYRTNAVPREASEANAQSAYNKAQEALGAGDLSAAADLYVQIIRDNPSSSYFPRALYQLAKIHTIQGEDLLASAELKTILDKYPAPDLYDKSCKSLADLSFRKGEYRLALSYLNEMVFIDPLFTPAQIAAYKATIEQKMGGAG